MDLEIIFSDGFNLTRHIGAFHSSGVPVISNAIYSDYGTSGDDTYNESCTIWFPVRRSRAEIGPRP